MPGKTRRYKDGHASHAGKESDGTRSIALAVCSREMSLEFPALLELINTGSLQAKLIGGILRRPHPCSPSWARGGF